MSTLQSTKYAAGLARVSDDRQSTIPDQRAWIEQAAKHQGYELVATVEDDGLSGDDLSRPGLLELERVLKSAREQGRAVTAVLAEYGDRLSRGDSLETFGMLRDWRRQGVRYLLSRSRVIDL